MLVNGSMMVVSTAMLDHSIFSILHKRNLYPKSTKKSNNSSKSVQVKPQQLLHTLEGISIPGLPCHTKGERDWSTKHRIQGDAVQVDESLPTAPQQNEKKMIKRYLVEHGCDAVETETVELELVHPPAAVAEEKPDHFPLQKKKRNAE